MGTVGKDADMLMVSNSCYSHMPAGCLEILGHWYCSTFPPAGARFQVLSSCQVDGTLLLLIYTCIYPYALPISIVSSTLWEVLLRSQPSDSRHSCFTGWWSYSGTVQRRQIKLISVLPLVAELKWIEAKAIFNQQGLQQYIYVRRILWKEVLLRPQSPSSSPKCRGTKSKYWGWKRDGSTAKQSMKWWIIQRKRETSNCGQRWMASSQTSE